ncbi:MAG TPA: FRG domain-containing protein [Rhodothermales bacterium]|nr:FRG domain-containing protein [Rhodothermales bacterium]
MTTIRIDSWAGLHEALFAESWNPSLQRFRSQYAFRGLSDASYELSTTLTRLGGRYVDMEAHLLRNFRKYAHHSVLEEDSVWDWLALAQHHGLPTRLMDWTYSPLVAMHFATANGAKFDRDGVIWAVHYGRVHEMLPKRLSEELQREGGDVFTAEMLAEVAPGLQNLERLSEEPFLLFVEPPSMDERIVNQYALFSMLSAPHASLDEWLAAHPAVWRKIVIPADLKWEIRDKLDQANVTERVLFPGLDGLSRWLTRHYRPRSTAPDQDGVVHRSEPL